jgi:hypothetical protein
MESPERAASVENLARLIHDLFDIRSQETGWTGAGQVVAWDDMEKMSIPRSYQEAIRLTAEDLLETDWFRTVVQAAASVALEEAAKDWVSGRVPDYVSGGVVTMGSSTFINAQVVSSWLKALARECEGRE